MFLQIYPGDNINENKKPQITNSHHIYYPPFPVNVHVELRLGDVEQKGFNRKRDCSA